MALLISLDGWGQGNFEETSIQWGIIVGASLATDRFDNVNSAFSFNGLDQYIDLSGNSNLELTAPYSVSLWFNSARSSTNVHRPIDRPLSSKDIIKAH